MKLCVILPALNEERTIACVIAGVPRTIDGIEDIEIIVIDDGSSDKTAEYGAEAGAIIISHDAPRGLGRVFQHGVHEALSRGADIMVTLDSDGQFDSADIPKLIAPILADKADVVSCSRFKEKKYTPQMPLFKKVGNHCMARFMKMLTGAKITDATCGFRAYTRDALLNLNLFGTFTYTQETLLDLIYKGFRYTEVSLPVRGMREFGESRMTNKLFRYMYRSLMAVFRSVRDYKPLTFIGGFGVFLFAVGVTLDIFVFNNYFSTGQFTPYKAIGFIGGFLNAMGVLIFVMALIADMLDRVRMTNEKILYFEKKRRYDK